ncbi:hypothetical protein NOR51B_1190 [Luminiphilus syltensis NOR5-1B]|uniref:Uncharacterized protein n=1 Tax=Luminiphilus syltensis NOR5-1B TaxID=565045 RepID=B8KX03_9GAMM|nr:hypothetical protein NOR51B_1190 [Luminiphilus syltensis NOR5-1B]
MPIPLPAAAGRELRGGGVLRGALVMASSRVAAKEGIDGSSSRDIKKLSEGMCGEYIALPPPD